MWKYNEAGLGNHHAHVVGGLFHLPLWHCVLRKDASSCCVNKFCVGVVCCFFATGSSGLNGSAQILGSQVGTMYLFWELVLLLLVHPSIMVCFPHSQPFKVGAPSLQSHMTSGFHSWDGCSIRRHFMNLPGKLNLVVEQCLTCLGSADRRQCVNRILSQWCYELLYRGTCPSS